MVYRSGFFGVWGGLWMGIFFRSCTGPLFLVPGSKKQRDFLQYRLLVLRGIFRGIGLPEVAHFSDICRKNRVWLLPESILHPIHAPCGEAFCLTASICGPVRDLFLLKPF